MYKTSLEYYCSLIERGHCSEVQKVLGDSEDETSREGIAIPSGRRHRALTNSWQESPRQAQPRSRHSPQPLQSFSYPRDSFMQLAAPADDTTCSKGVALSSIAAGATADHRFPSKLQIKATELKLSTLVLGRGSYGEVRLGWCRGSHVAVKLPHLVLFQPGQESVLESFLNECHRLSDMRHPNIVLFMGVVNINGALALVTERMRCSLTNFLESRSRQVSIAEKLNIIRDVAVGLAYLHTCDPPLVHKDLTSNNVLLTSDRDPTAKIADLGAARLYDPNKEKYTRCPGTVAYMPPEVLDVPVPDGSPPIDVFSLGVLKVQTITGKFPSPSCKFEQVGQHDHHVKRSEIERRSTELEEMESILRQDGGPMDLYHLARQCLDDTPQNRPTALDIVKNLGFMLNDEEDPCTLQTSTYLYPLDEHKPFTHSPVHCHTKGIPAQPSDLSNPPLMISNSTVKDLGYGGLDHKSNSATCFSGPATNVGTAVAFVPNTFPNTSKSICTSQPSEEFELPADSRLLARDSEGVDTSAALDSETLPPADRYELVEAPPVSQPESSKQYSQPEGHLDPVTGQWVPGSSLHSPIDEESSATEPFSSNETNTRILAENSGLNSPEMTFPQQISCGAGISHNPDSSDTATVAAPLFSITPSGSNEELQSANSSNRADDHEDEHESSLTAEAANTAALSFSESSESISSPPEGPSCSAGFQNPFTVPLTQTCKLSLMYCADLALHSSTLLRLSEIPQPQLSTAKRSDSILQITGRAKIADSGMSKLLDANRHITYLTMCPGTVAYMPPEALRRSTAYSMKIACISSGVLRIQITIHQFPAADILLCFDIQSQYSSTQNTQFQCLDPWYSSTPFPCSLSKDPRGEASEEVLSLVHRSHERRLSLVPLFCYCMTRLIYGLQEIKKLCLLPKSVINTDKPCTVLSRSSEVCDLKPEALIHTETGPSVSIISTTLHSPIDVYEGEPKMLLTVSSQPSELLCEFPTANEHCYFQLARYSYMQKSLHAASTLKLSNLCTTKDHSLICNPLCERGMSLCVIYMRHCLTQVSFLARCLRLSQLQATALLVNEFTKESVLDPRMITPQPLHYLPMPKSPVSLVIDSRMITPQPLHYLPMPKSPVSLVIDPRMITPQPLHCLPMPKSPVSLVIDPRMITPQPLHYLPMPKSPVSLVIDPRMITPQPLHYLPMPKSPMSLVIDPRMITPQPLHYLPMPKSPVSLVIDPRMITPQPLHYLPMPKSPVSLVIDPRMITPQPLHYLPMPKSPVSLVIDSRMITPQPLHYLPMPKSPVSLVIDPRMITSQPLHYLPMPKSPVSLVMGATSCHAQSLVVPNSYRLYFNNESVSFNGFIMQGNYLLAVHAYSSGSRIQLIVAMYCTGVLISNSLTQATTHAHHSIAAYQLYSLALFWLLSQARQTEQSAALVPRYPQSPSNLSQITVTNCHLESSMDVVTNESQAACSPESAAVDTGALMLVATAVASISETEFSERESPQQTSLMNTATGISLNTDPSDIIAVAPNSTEQIFPSTPPLFVMEHIPQILNQQLQPNYSDTADGNEHRISQTRGAADTAAISVTESSSSILSSSEKPSCSDEFPKVSAMLLTYHGQVCKSQHRCIITCENQLLLRCTNVITVLLQYHNRFSEIFQPQPCTAVTKCAAAFLCSAVNVQPQHSNPHSQYLDSQFQCSVTQFETRSQYSQSNDPVKAPEDLSLVYDPRHEESPSSPAIVYYRMSHQRRKNLCLLVKVPRSAMITDMSSKMDGCLEYLMPVTPKFLRKETTSYKALRQIWDELASSATAIIFFCQLLYSSEMVSKHDMATEPTLDACSKGMILPQNNSSEALMFAETGQNVSITSLMFTETGQNVSITARSQADVYRGEPENPLIVSHQPSELLGECPITSGNGLLNRMCCNTQPVLSSYMLNDLPETPSAAIVERHSIKPELSIQKLAEDCNPIYPLCKCESLSVNYVRYCQVSCCLHVHLIQLQASALLVNELPEESPKMNTPQELHHSQMLKSLTSETMPKPSRNGLSQTSQKVPAAIFDSKGVIAFQSQHPIPTWTVSEDNLLQIPYKPWLWIMQYLIENPSVIQGAQNMSMSCCTLKDSPNISRNQELLVQVVMRLQIVHQLQYLPSCSDIASCHFKQECASFIVQRDIPLAVYAYSSNKIMQLKVAAYCSDGLLFSNLTQAMPRRTQTKPPHRRDMMPSSSQSGRAETREGKRREVVCLPNEAKVLHCPGDSPKSKANSSTQGGSGRSRMSASVSGGTGTGSSRGGSRDDDQGDKDPNQPRRDHEATSTRETSREEKGPTLSSENRSFPMAQPPTLLNGTSSSQDNQVQDIPRPLHRVDATESDNPGNDTSDESEPPTEHLPQGRAVLVKSCTEISHPLQMETVKKRMNDRDKPGDEDEDSRMHEHETASRGDNVSLDDKTLPHDDVKMCTCSELKEHAASPAHIQKPPKETLKPHASTCNSLPLDTVKRKAVKDLEEIRAEELAPVGKLRDRVVDTSKLEKLQHDDVQMCTKLEEYVASPADIQTAPEEEGTGTLKPDASNLLPLDRAKKKATEDLEEICAEEPAAAVTPPDPDAVISKPLGDKKLQHDEANTCTELNEHAASPAHIQKPPKETLKPHASTCNSLPLDTVKKKAAKNPHSEMSVLVGDVPDHVSKPLCDRKDDTKPCTEQGVHTASLARIHNSSESEMPPKELQKAAKKLEEPHSSSASEDTDPEGKITWKSKDAIKQSGDARPENLETGGLGGKPSVKCEIEDTRFTDQLEDPMIGVASSVNQNEYTKNIDTPSGSTAAYSASPEDSQSELKEECMVPSTEPALSNESAVETSTSVEVSSTTLEPTSSQLSDSAPCITMPSGELDSEIPTLDEYGDRNTTDEGIPFQERSKFNISDRDHSHAESQLVAGIPIARRLISKDALVPGMIRLQTKYSPRPQDAQQICSFQSDSLHKQDSETDSAASSISESDAEDDKGMDEEAQEGSPASEPPPPNHYLPEPSPLPSSSAVKLFSAAHSDESTNALSQIQASEAATLNAAMEQVKLDGGSSELVVGSLLSGAAQSNQDSASSSESESGAKDGKSVDEEEFDLDPVVSEESPHPSHDLPELSPCSVLFSDESKNALSLTQDSEAKDLSEAVEEQGPDYLLDGISSELVVGNTLSGANVSNQKQNPEPEFFSDDDSPETLQPCISHFRSLVDVPQRCSQQSWAPEAVMEENSLESCCVPGCIAQSIPSQVSSYSHVYGNYFHY